jgi:hypothetical protein
VEWNYFLSNFAQSNWTGAWGKNISYSYNFGRRWNGKVDSHALIAPEPTLHSLGDRERTDKHDLTCIKS